MNCNIDILSSRKKQVQLFIKFKFTRYVLHDKFADKTIFHTQQNKFILRKSVNFFEPLRRRKLKRPS